MKLIQTSGNHLLFEIGRNEKKLLSDILQLYPMVSSAHHRLARNPSTTGLEDHQKLLEESLAAQRTEHRKKIQALLSEPGRFQSVDSGFQFKMSPLEIEWLLQVLNDIRIGSWIALGSPDTEHGDKIRLDETTAPRVRSMEIAGAFETVILDGLAGRQTVAAPRQSAGKQKK